MVLHYGTSVAEKDGSYWVLLLHLAGALKRKGLGGGGWFSGGSEGPPTLPHSGFSVSPTGDTDVLGAASAPPPQEPKQPAPGKRLNLPATGLFDEDDDDDFFAASCSKPAKTGACSSLFLDFARKIILT